MLRRGIYGIYKNVEYEITIDMEENVFIMTENKEKIDGTFKETKSGDLFIKLVHPNDLSECINITPYGIIEDEKVDILQEREDQYQIGTGDLLIGSKLKLPRIDRDEWLGWVPKCNVTLVEEKRKINLHELL